MVFGVNEPAPSTAERSRYFDSKQNTFFGHEFRKSYEISIMFVSYFF